MSSLGYRLALLAIVVAKGYCSLEVKLVNLTSTEVYENENIMLKCYYNGTLENPYVNWIIEGVNGRPFTHLTDGICSAIGYLNDTSAYGYSCLGNNAFTITLKNVSHDKDDRNVTCFRQFTASNNITIHVKGVHQQTVLFPYNAEVFENENITLLCSLKNSNATVSLWDFDNTGASYIKMSNNNCIAGGLFTDKNYFAYTCYTNHSFSITLKNVNQTQHGRKLACYINYSKSNFATIFVKVPVKMVSLATFANFIPENHSATFFCNTSYARPMPTIRWLLDPSTAQPADEKEIKYGVSNETVEKGKLFSIISTLQTSFNRTTNKWKIYCTASNVPGVNISTKRTTLNINYPPESPPEIRNCNNCTSYRIVEYSQGNLSCLSTGGNPLAELEWTCLSVDVAPVIENNTVMKHIYWNASRNMAETCSCVSKHIAGQSLTTSIHIVVLYPPTVAVMENQSIIEGSRLNISCPATPGVPENTTFQWTKRSSQLNTSSKNLIIETVHRNDAAEYSCIVRNRMIPTVGGEQVGQHSGNFHLDVLYPAGVGKLEDITIIEGASINITCQVIPGNPPSDARVTWTARSAVSVSNSHRILYFSNISREHDQMYTCEVTSKMEPTIGSNEERVNNVSFQLRVVYKAVVMQFFTEGYRDKNITTLNETDDITIHCNMDSNPPAGVNISHDGNDVLFTVRNNISYTKKYVQCNDSGIYTCSGMNKYNSGISSKKNLTVYVNCSPRPSSLVEVKENISSARNSKAMFSFTALAYPAPGPSGFIWNYLNGTHPVKLTNSSTVAISSSFLQTNLTILNVTDSDFGDYLLLIQNSIGVFEQRYHLMPYEHSRRIEGNIAPIIGIVIGCLVFVLVTFTAVVLIILLYRRYQKKKDRVNERSSVVRSFQEVSEMKTIADAERSCRNETAYERIRPDKDRGITERMECTYETIRPDKGRETCEKNEIDFGERKTDTEDLGSSIPVYTNLTLQSC